MLIRTDTLEAIRDGRVTLAFRRWTRPTVRSGGTLLTALGELEIVEVCEVDPGSITDDQARAAGFDDLGDLLAELNRRPSGTCHRIAFGALRPDPRIALRSRSELTAAEREEVIGKLRLMDARSADGSWTEATLRVIADHPQVRAADICVLVGRERDPFKTNVRKLKRLGLTESLPVGYRLSPRGRAILAAVTDPAWDRSTARRVEGT